VFEEGELLHTAVIPIGSEHITADIAIGLRCPINLADRIKIEYGTALAGNFNKKDELDISELAAEENAVDELKTIKRKYLAEIIGARVEEIFEKVDNEFKEVERSGMLPGGVFLIGGGTKLPGITEMAKKQLRLPASLGNNSNIKTVIDKVNDTMFLNALGLVVWGNQVNEGNRSLGLKIPGGAVIDKFLKKIVDWFKSLIP